MNYFERIAKMVWQECGGDDDFYNDHSLWNIYALLALTTGEDTTNENVHDAWAAWRNRAGVEHKSLIPFSELSKEIQDYDSPYRDAIIRVARTLNDR